MSDVPTAHTKIWKELSLFPRLFLIKSPFAFSTPSNTSNPSNIECRHELSESYSYTQAHGVDTYAHYCNSCCLALLLELLFAISPRRERIYNSTGLESCCKPTTLSVVLDWTRQRFDWVTLNSACRLGYESSR